METCYICFENYTVKGRDCYKCKKSCCGDCYMKKFMESQNFHIKCDSCNYKYSDAKFSKESMYQIVVNEATELGFSNNGNL